jgi:Uncharacterized NAD(FAD)-dependent dehydrogenases
LASKKIVIVGGVAGGATAAARLRRLDEDSHIIIFERGEYISFANCGLPYHIGEVIPQREQLLVQSIEGLSTRFNLDIRNLSEVVAINREQQSVTVKNIATGEMYTETYDTLLLAPGAKPVEPPIPGLNEAQNIFTLRTIPDTDRIKQFVDQQHPRNAVIIGGGFIGLEMTENLVQRNVHVIIVEKNDQVMRPLDKEMVAPLHQHLRDHHVDLLFGDAVEAFEQQGHTIVMGSGKTIQADIVILSIGVRPENTLAVQSGLAVGTRSGIVTNEYLQTSDEHIYAIGDAIEVKNFVSAIPTLIPLAGPANRQARVVADNIYGKKTVYKGVLGTAIAKVFDLTVAAVGLNARELQRIGLPYQVAHTHPMSHASYYPDSLPLSLKLLFHPDTGALYGAQAVGLDGVDKRIDVLATAIKTGLTVFDLADLELAYAPPYSAAKDPVNQIGYLASNIVDGSVKTIQYHEIDAIVAQGGLLIDVREPLEFALGAITGAQNIPLGDLRQHLADLPHDQPIYVNCQVGQRGYYATRILSAHGFNAFNLDGGYKTYRAAFQIDWPTSNTHVQKIAAGEGLSMISAVKPVSGEIPSTAVSPTMTIDACGLQCPGPITKVYQAMQELAAGDTLQISASDPGFVADIQSWCKKTGNTLINISKDDKTYIAAISKGKAQSDVNVQIGSASSTASSTQDGATLIVFDQDMDKALASFIIATGAAAMGKPVTMFFTFWGLNVLRREQSPSMQKGFLDSMFGRMMPKGPSHLPLSNMNMGGLGKKMMTHVMRKKNVDSLPTLIHNAQQMGVKIVACSMSMDVMGIRAEELIDGIEIGGVATFLSHAQESNVNLFI